MKICPDCQTRFDGNEAFCPNDGSQLVEAKELSPGALTGTTIGKMVKLERLTWSDHFGERYAGRMLDTKGAVHVTVVNTGIQFDDDAARRIEATRARVGSPLPAEINTLLRTELDHVPSFVIHTAPRGPSLREILEERESLDWETAARLTCRAARASEWLLEQEVVHWALHAGSVYVSRLAEGAVQLGEWYFDSLMGNRAPETRLQAGEPFPGYLEVMAPEIAEGQEADERSVVFALGALFFELVTGKAPFVAGTPQATLERIKAESAVKLSIAAGAEGVHPELDQVIGMMLARDPEKRLQKPGAAIAVLSNILGSTPDEVAPEIERGDEAFDELYATTELSAFDRDRVPDSEADEDAGDDQPGNENKDLSKKTLLMAGSATLEQKLAEDAASSDAEPEEEEKPTTSAAASAGISGSSTTADGSDEAGSETSDDEANNAAPGAPVVEEAPNTDPIDSPASKKTLLMGAIGDQVVAGQAATGKDDEEPSDTPSSGVSGESSTKSEPTDDSEDEIAVEPTPESEIETRELDRDGDERGTDAPPAVESGTAGDVDEIDPEDTQKLDLASSEVDREKESSDSATPGGSNELQIGFVEAPQGADSGGADDWFSGTTEDAWERTLAEEHAQESEKRWKLVLSIALGAVVFAGLALIIYSQFIWEPESTDEAVAEQVEEESTPDEPEVDVERLVNRFERALEAGRISSPPGNSAYSALQELLKYAPEDEQTVTATSEFVNAAVKQAEKAEAAGNLRVARTLLGHATTVAPDDNDLRDAYQDVDDRYRGTLGSLDGTDAGTVAVADAGEAPAEDTATASTETPTEDKTAKTNPTPKPDPKPDTKDRPKPEPKESISDILAKARQAYSRDDLRTAESLYNKAIGIQSSSHVANAGLGQVYFDQGAYARAVRYQMQAVRSKPDSVAYRINLGQSYYRLGKYSDAIRSWEAALERDPGNSNAKRYIELAQKKLD